MTPSIDCEKPDSLFREKEREGEPEIRHVSRFVNALLITCRKRYCPSRLHEEFYHERSTTFPRSRLLFLMID